ncbi:RNA polymerase sigma factor [Pontibacter sp. KCTC 32443]|uniref:RNA polymerase sigma factor n=1 Tax=Pontibacter TaxID=323449 RepID=UPI00164CF6B1|nr:MULTISPECIES: RNA polymerase sigma factor [Pontibacter]MBC5774971.1 RNA polymerase sigma factor [Pontibacter sp. KCTC 32443]
MQALHYSIPLDRQLPDAEVITKVLAGEKELYELLMRRHNQKLYRVIRSYLKNEREVEDAMQDTYLKAYEKLYQFRQDSQFSTWLIRIGINAALGKLRKYKQLAEAPSDLIDYDVLPSSETLPMDPENIIIRNEAKLLLEKAIDAIPEKYRIVYTLRELEDLSVQEVMNCLELSESNVKIRLHRAKALLKDNLYKLTQDKQVFEFGNKRCDALVHQVLKALP